MTHCNESRAKEREQLDNDKKSSSFCQMQWEESTFAQKFRVITSTSFLPSLMHTFETDRTEREKQKEENARAIFPFCSELTRMNFHIVQEGLLFITLSWEMKH